MLIIASQSYCHSSSESCPRRTRCMSTRASVQSMRMASCSAGISSEKTAAFLPARMAAFSMKFMPILVLPMDGRPATSTSSPGVQTGQHIVQLGIARGHAFDFAVVFNQQLDLFEGAEQNRLNGLKLFAALAHGDVVNRLFGGFQNVLRLLLRRRSIPSRCSPDAAISLRSVDFSSTIANVRLHVGRGGHRSAELDQIRRAAHRVQLAAAGQLLVQRDQIDCRATQLAMASMAE